MRSKGLIDQDVLQPGLTDLYALADVAASTLNPKATCESLCTTRKMPECCRERNFTQSEFEYIAASRGTTDMISFANDFATAPARSGWCPFLGDDGLCGVHEDRPLECRILGDLEAVSCRSTQPDKSTVRVRSIVRESLYRLLTVVAGAGPRRTLGEMLLEFKLRYDQTNITRRLP